MKGSLTQVLSQAKQRLRIEDIISEHTVLRKSGKGLSGLCPIHQERTPSFNVSPDKQLFHCHGCKRGGDMVAFLMEMHGLGFREAVIELAERAKIPLTGDITDPKLIQAQERSSYEKDLSFKLNRFVASFYHQNLKNNPAALAYLKKRGVEGAWLESFYVGLAQASWDSLSNYLVSKKAPMEIALELGLIQPSKNTARNGSGYFDLFRDRVVFPIVDMRGKVCAFGGRVMDPEQSPKYLNSPESKIFHKSKTLFGLFQAQKHIREEDSALLVEGYFDVLAMHRHGFANTVATCGTALTDDHLRTLSKFCSKIVIVFDGDEAGKRGAEKAMETGLAAGMVVYGLTLPQGLDPDEFLDQNPENAGKLRQMIADAKPIIDQRIEDAIAYARKGNEEKVQAIKQLSKWLALFTDPIGKKLRIGVICERLAVGPELFLGAQGPGGHASGPIRPVVRPNTAPIRDARPAPSVRPAKLSPAEERVFSWILKGSSRFELEAIKAEFGPKMPPSASSELSICDLFVDLSVRAFMARALSDPAFLERFRRDPSGVLGGFREGGQSEGLMEGTGEGTGDFSAHIERLKPLLLDVIFTDLRSPGGQESLIESAPEGAQEEGGHRAEHSTSALPEEIKTASLKLLAGAWARFSHGLRLALADAEAKQDKGLHDNLLQQYLDVQRKMKEFNSFYDEA